MANQSEERVAVTYTSCLVCKVNPASNLDGGICPSCQTNTSADILIFELLRNVEELAKVNKVYLKKHGLLLTDSLLRLGKILDSLQ